MENKNNNLRSQKVGIILILLLSLAIRFIFVMTMDREGFYFIDTKDYDNAAVDLINERTFGFNYERPPVYPLFLAGVYFISHQNFLLVRVIQCGLGTLIVILVFIIGKKIYGIRTAFIAALISAVYPIFIFTSGLLYPTTLITLWLLLIILFLLKAMEQRSLLNCSMAGLFMGIAILTKPVTMILFGVFILYFFIKKNSVESKKFLSVSLFIFCACLVASTWVIRNYHFRGELSAIESNRRLETMLKGLDKNPNKKSLPISKRIYRIIIQNRDKFIKHFFSEVIHFWSLYPDRVATKNKSKRQIFKEQDERLQMKNPYIGNFTKYISIISFTPILCFAIIGFIASILRQKNVLLVFSPIFSFWFGYSLLFTQIRYRIPIEPFLIILSAFGLTVIGEWISPFVAKRLAQKQ